MRLQKDFFGVVIGFGLVMGLSLPAQASIEDSLNYYDTDDHGNAVYFGLGVSGDQEFIFVDGSSTAGMFSSASIAIIQTTQEAGYAVVPANDFQEMSRNAQFAKIYTVDCDRQRVTDEDGEVMRLSNASAFHQTTSSMVCSVLE